MFGKGKRMKAWRRILALVGIVMGLGALAWAALIYALIAGWLIPSFMQIGNIGAPVIYTADWTWAAYASVATPATLGMTLIVVSYRFGFRRRAKPGVAANAGLGTTVANSGAAKGPPSVS
jgi:hypothetical protein